jgi:hypothetical protein
MMLKVVPYIAEHLDMFEQRECDIERYGKYTSETQFALADYGTTFTVMYDGRIVLLGGILQTSLHTGKCWTMISKYAQACGATLFWQLKRHMESMMQDMRLHRIDTANIKEATDHHRWCKLLGFVQEGEMPLYDDQKRTYIRFAKFMENASWE